MPGEAVSQNRPPLFPMEHALPGLAFGTAAWGDYDADGDFDVVMVGQSADTEFFSAVYRNDGDTPRDEGPIILSPVVSPPGISGQSLDGSLNIKNDNPPTTIFRLISRLSQPLNSGNAVWGDFDRDGDLDILATGMGNDGVPYAYTVENRGRDVFETRDVLYGVHSGKGSWADYDADGDFDILLCGIDETGDYVSILYENKGILFVRHNPGFIGVAYGDFAWGDYDNDGDLDVVLTGLTRDGVFETRLYRSGGGGAFVEVEMGLADLAYGSVDWGDYDNDGDLDLVLSGGRPGPFILEADLKVYTNEGGTLIDTPVDISGQYYGDASWGDYDNDGDLDLLVSGGTHSYEANNTNPIGPRVDQLFRNDGNGVFIPTNPLSASSAFTGSACWGDYNNDGDLDLLVTGVSTQGEAVTNEWRNERESLGLPPNSPPEIPANLESSVFANGVTLTWSPSSDLETPAAALTYNVWVSTLGAIHVIPPMSDRSTGHRLIPERGNTGTLTRWTIRDLHPGTYYWSVQAVDHSYKGSPFAKVQTFTIGP